MTTGDEVSFKRSLHDISIRHFSFRLACIVRGFDTGSVLIFTAARATLPSSISYEIFTFATLAILVKAVIFDSSLRPGWSSSPFHHRIVSYAGPTFGGKAYRLRMSHRGWEIAQSPDVEMNNHHSRTVILLSHFQVRS
jgi:hypothetical protein